LKHASTTIVEVTHSVAERDGSKEMDVRREARRDPGGGPALACNLGAMDVEQRERYRALLQLLSADSMEAQELENGYAFRHSSDAGVLVALAEYVSLERLCCPFFDFAIEVRRNGSEVWLKITGPKGAKTILEDALGDRS
jgi:hypothetical protein